MQTVIISILITILAFSAMEFIAWFTHKYVMHGWLLKLHKDHHKKDTDGFFEYNVFFFFPFSLLCIFDLFYYLCNCLIRIYSSIE